MKEEEGKSEEKSSTTTSTSPSSAAKKEKETLEIEFPNYWEPQDSDHQIFVVKEGSLEYNSIVDRFAETLPQATVKKIQRNQNR